MPMNTPYIGQSSVLTTDFSSDLSVFGTSVFSSDVQFFSTTSFVGAASLGAATLASTLSVAGVPTFDAEILVVNGIDMNTSQATFLSRQTSASLTSATLADGELSVGSVSVTSATIYFRSGVTTYEFIADAAGVL